MRYRLSVPEGTLARVRVAEESGNIAVVIRELDSGEHVIALDMPFSSKAAEEAILESGQYCVQVAPSPRKPCARHRIRIGYELSEPDRYSPTLLAIQACEAWGQALLNRGKAKQALSYFKSGLAKSKGLPDSHDRRASFHFWLGVAQAGLNNREDALASFDEGIALQPTDWIHADALLWKSGLLLNSKSPSDEDFREDILDLLNRALDRCPNPVCRAQVHNNLAAVRRRFSDYVADRRGDLEKARHSALKAREDFRRHGETVLEAVALTALGTIVQELGAPREAAEYFKDGLALYSRLESDCEIPKSLLGAKGWLLSDAGLAQARMGRVQDAREYYQRAIALAEEIGDGRLAVTGLNNLGSLYIDTNAPLQARQRLREALDSPHLPPGLKAKTLNNLARAYEVEAPSPAGDQRKKDLRLARNFYQKALADIYQRAGGGTPNPSLLAMVRSSLGAHHLATGDPEAALVELEKALTLRTTLKDQVGQYRTRLKLGRAFLALGKDDQALLHLSEATDLSEELHDSVTSARARMERAGIFLRRGDPGAARADLDKALEVVESQRLEVAGEYRKSSYFSVFRPVYELYVSLLMRQDEKRAAFEMSEKSRARSLLDTLRLGRAEPDEGSPDRGLDERRTKVLEELYAKNDLQERLRRKSRHAGRAREVEALELEIQRLVSHLRSIDEQTAARHPGRRHVLGAPQATVAEVQSHLEPDTLLLEYFVASDRTFLWVIGNSFFEAYSVEHGQKEVETIVKAVYEDIRNQNPSYQASLDLAGPLIPRPVLEEIGNKRLAVVPDGPLHFLPFGLLGTLDGRPLFETNELVNLPSASYILEKRRSRTSRNPEPTVFVIANPTYKSRIPLPASSQEAERVRAIAERSGRLKCTVRLGDDARIEALQGAGSSRFLHFAVHGRYDSRLPELSALLLSDVEGDGRLDLHEIYDLSLKAELVVLNGCETAMGPLLKGEGVLSLTRAFLHAGAKQAMASLWRVQDKASARFAELFYEGLIDDDLSPAGALRQAQQKMSVGQGRDRRWRHPCYWATFVLYGDWRH